MEKMETGMVWLARGIPLVFFERHLINVFVPPRATYSLDEDGLARKGIDQYLKDSLPHHALNRALALGQVFLSFSCLNPL